MSKPIITAEMLAEAYQNTYIPQYLFREPTEREVQNTRAMIAERLTELLNEQLATAEQEPQEDLDPKFRELENMYAVVRTCDIEKYDTSYLYWEAFIKKGKLSATHTEALQRDKLLLLTTKYKAYVAEYNGVPMGESRWREKTCIWYVCIINDKAFTMWTNTTQPDKDIELYLKDNEFGNFILKRMTIEEIRIVTTQDWRAIEV